MRITYYKTGMIEQLENGTFVCSEGDLWIAGGYATEEAAKMAIDDPVQAEEIWATFSDEDKGTKSIEVHDFKS